MVVLAVTGCSNMVVVEPPVKDPPARLFYGSFDQIWRNIQLTLRKYPVRVNNIDGGILETDYIKDEKLFSSPMEAHTKPGTRYKLTVRAVKGQVEGKPVIKVTFLKLVELQKNFFEGFQPISSDSLEELALLYRIGRFTELDQLLSKVSAEKKPQVLKKKAP